MRIDHLIYAAPDLHAAVADIEDRFGVRAGGGGKHLGQGTHNTLIALGPRTYLELIAPDPEQPEPAQPRPYGADGVTSGGLVGWAVETDDIEAALRRTRDRGFDPGEVIDGQRVTSSGTTLRWRLTANARTAGLVPFLIDWGSTPHPAGSAATGLSLASVRVESPDPAGLVGRLRALGVEMEVRRGSREALVAVLSGPRGDLELR